MTQTTIKQALQFTLVALLACTPAMAGRVTYSPLTQSVAQGTPVSVDVLITGLGNGTTPALGGYDLTVFFDSSILTPTTVNFTSRLGDTSDPLQVLSFNNFVLVGGNIVGVELVELSFLSASDLFSQQTTANAGFKIATLGFNTGSAGVSTLTTSVASAADENSNAISLTTDSGSVTVTSTTPASVTPEPGTILLLSSGLLLVVGRSAFRR
jgi:hypothetical protein